MAASKVAGAAGMMDKLSNYIIVDIGANLTNKGQYFAYTVLVIRSVCCRLSCLRLVVK